MRRILQHLGNSYVSTVKNTRTSHASSILCSYLAHFLSSVLKNFSCKNFSYFFLKRAALKNFLKLSPRSPPNVQETELSYFRERYIQKLSIFRTLICSKPETYSEHCQTSTIKSFIKNSYLAHFLTSTRKFFPKKTCFEKISYIFPKGSFSYISRNRTLNLPASSPKIFP